MFFRVPSRPQPRGQGRPQRLLTNADDAGGTRGDAPFDAVCGSRLCVSVDVTEDRRDSPPLECVGRGDKVLAGMIASPVGETSCATGVSVLTVALQTARCFNAAIRRSNSGP